MVQFFYITQAIYDSFSVSGKIVDDHLYFIKDGKRLYRGKELIASSGEADAKLAALEAAIIKNSEDIVLVNNSIAAHIKVTDAMQNIINDLVTNVGNLNNALENKLDTSVFNSFKTNSFDVLEGIVADKASQSALNNLSSTVNGKADSSSVYTKEQIDEKVNTINLNLDEKVDESVLTNYTLKTSVYTKNEIDNQLTEKVDKTSLNNYYTKTQIDTELDDKVDITTLSDYYIKSETYSKAEANSLLSNKTDSSITEGLETKINTLMGADNNKSVREIASEELAEQLIAENADLALDTLEEIAKWIQDHPDDAAAMNQAIKDLENLVGSKEGLPSDYENILDYLAKTKTSLEGLIDNVSVRVGENTSAIESKASKTEINALSKDFETFEENYEIQETAIKTIANEVYGVTDGSTSGNSRIDQIISGDIKVKNSENAETALLSTQAIQDEDGRNITITYETKEDSGKNLESAKSYAETQATIEAGKVKTYVDTIKYAGSNSIGGKANSAVIADTLNANAGSVIQPVYFEEGIPKNISYTIEKSVPSDAVFTDTHYISNNIVGNSKIATSNVNNLSNGNVYLNSIENSQVTSSHRIIGSGATEVTTDISGNIIISSENTEYFEAGSDLGLVKTGGDVNISGGIITVVDDSHNHTVNSVTGLQDVINKADLGIKEVTVNGTTLTFKRNDNSAFNITTQDTDNNTDELVKQTPISSTTNTAYPLLLARHGLNSEVIEGVQFDNQVTLNPITNTIAANISGKAAEAENANNAAHATNADLATKATKDESGNNIVSTYATKESMTGLETSLNSLSDTVTGYGISIKNLQDNSATKTELSSSLANKLDASTISNYYTKTETYNKIEINNSLNVKADTSSVYTKTEADNLLKNKTNTSVTNEISAKVDKLIGSDNDKSVREIAAEELAEQLIQDGASTSLDTLEEIAAWIQDHPDDAAAMNNDILKLYKYIGNITDLNSESLPSLPAGSESLYDYVGDVNSSLIQSIETVDRKVDKNIEDIAKKVNTSTYNILASTVENHGLSINNLTENKADKTAVDNLILEIYGGINVSDSRLDGFDTQFITVNSAIEDLQEDVSALELEVDKKASIEALTIQQDRIDNLYTELTGSVDGSLNNSKLDQVITAAATNTTNIASNLSAINENAIKINANSANIEENTTSISNINTSIEEILGYFEWKTSM